MATFDSKTIVMMAENGHSVEIDGKKIQMTIVQEAVETKLDYSHLVGKWYKVLESPRIDTVFHGKHMKCFGLDKIVGTPLMGNDSFGTDYHGLSNPVINIYGWNVPEEVFDLFNPLDHNPDDVRVFDVPSEIKIVQVMSSLGLLFNNEQVLWYNSSYSCYGVVAGLNNAYDIIPCIATECKFEDLQEGDLFFATDDEKQDFARLRFYNFLSIDNGYVWTDGRNVNVLFEQKYTHYFKITPKP